MGVAVYVVIFLKKTDQISSENLAGKEKRVTAKEQSAIVQQLDDGSSQNDKTVSEQQKTYFRLAKAELFAGNYENARKYLEPLSELALAQDIDIEVINDKNRNEFLEYKNEEKNDPSVFCYVVEDENGEPSYLSVKLYDKDEKAWCQYSKGEDNCLSVRKKTVCDSEKITSVYYNKKGDVSQEYILDLNGNVLTYKGYKMDGSEGGRMEYERDEDGDAIVLRRYMNGNLYEYSEYSYDASKNLLSEIDYDLNEKTEIEKVNRYDANGNKCSRIVYDRSKGTVLADWSFTYDEKGNELSQIDNLNKTVEQKQSVKYDLNNNIVEEIDYGSDGSIGGITRYEYNEQGIKTSEIYSHDNKKYENFYTHGFLEKQYGYVDGELDSTIRLYYAPQALMKEMGIE